MRFLMRRGRIGPRAPAGNSGALAGEIPGRRQGRTRRLGLKAYHVAYTAARIITRALVAQLAYLVCSPENLQNS
jgi:hypothetical protein